MWSKRQYHHCEEKEGLIESLEIMLLGIRAPSKSIIVEMACDILPAGFKIASKGDVNFEAKSRVSRVAFNLHVLDDHGS